MSISEKSLSIKSSLLNSEMLGVRRAKEKKEYSLRELHKLQIE